MVDMGNDVPERWQVMIFRICSGRSQTTNPRFINAWQDPFLTSLPLRPIIRDVSLIRKYADDRLLSLDYWLQTTNALFRPCLARFYEPDTVRESG